MMFKKALGKMKGPVKVNETAGLLFEEGVYLRFGYRHSGQRICVDNFGFFDRLFLAKEGQRNLVGYDLSGKPADRRYDYLRDEIPEMPVIGHYIREEDVMAHNGGIVVYKGNLAVVLNRGITYREGFADQPILEELERHAEYDPRRAIVLIEFWGGPMAIKHTGKNLGSIQRNQCDLILSRNGI